MADQTDKIDKTENKHNNELVGEHNDETKER